MTIKVAINGAGRIGRAFYKLANENKNIDVVALNDLGDLENIAYLLNHDSVYGKSDLKAKPNSDGTSINIDDKDVKFFSEKDPSLLPWKELEIDVVVESTGVFTKYESAKAHLDAGAKKVVVSAPMKDEPADDIRGATVLMGVNDDKLSTCDISSNASCTTNASSPIIAILDEALGVEKALLNTIHAYTASQSLVDGPVKKKFQDGRAAAQNIIPSSTGAAIAVTKAFTSLEGLFDGVAVRVPVVAGSIADITFISKKSTSTEEVNEILLNASKNSRWEGIFKASEEGLVSTDIIGERYGAIADLSMTRVVGGNLVKVMVWYDNEMGYAHTLLQHVLKTGSNL